MRLVFTQERHAPAGAATGESYDLVIHMGEVAESRLTAASLVEIVRRGLSAGPENRHPARRRCKVYLASGEEREFVLDDDA